MYNVSTNFKNYIKSPSRTLSSRVVIETNTYTDTDIVDMTLESNLVPGEEFTLGCAVCSKFEGTIMTVNNIMELGVVRPYIGLDINGVVEEVPLGVFNIDNVKVIKGNKKIVAYDNMIKFEKAYFSDLSYPTSIQNIASEICQKAGVGFSSVLPNYTIDEIEGKNLREAIGIIAGLCGGFAKIDRSGNLQINSLITTDKTISSDNFFGSIEKADRNFTIKKITAIKEDKTTISSGNGLQSEEVTFSNNFITQAIINDILASYNNYSYRPLNINWQGDPSIDIGDKITITDVDNIVYTIPVIRNKLSYSGGLKSEISSVAKSNSKSEYDYKGPISKKVERLVIEQANIKEALIYKATIDDLTATNAKIDNANINIASINTLLAGNLSVNNMQAGFITAESGLIANGAIKDAMILSLSADKINAGKINTNLVTIQSSSGNMLISDNTIQIKDAARVRVQIGKDASNDYNMYVWDNSGNLMFDATGLKANGIKDKIIRDDMVSDTANIQGTKLDINSVVSSINGATTLLKATKIKLDTENQTLDVAFTSLKSTVTTQGNTITSQGTSITTIQGQISSKVWQQDITSAVTNIQVGGRNLIKNSKSAVINAVNGGWMAQSSINGGMDCTVVATLSYAYRWFEGDLYDTSLTNIKGGQLTLSLDFKTNKADLIKIYFSVRTASNTDSVSSNTLNIPNTNNMWQRFSVTLNLPTDAIDRSRIIYYISGFNCIIGDTFSYRNIKLEFGNKATDWTPAPEDIDSQITTINTNYSSLNQTVNSISANVSSLQTTTSSLGTRMSSAEGSITTLNNSISLKVSTTDFNIYKTTNDSAVSSKASQADLNTTNNNLTSLTSRVTTTESSISILQSQIVSKVSQTDVANYVSSRGENLVTNGTGLLGDNTNFSAFTFDKSDSYSAGGSFKDSAYNVARTSDELIPVDISKTYRLNLYAKCSPYVGAKYYTGVCCYDVDKLAISPTHYMYISNTLTTLAQDLKVGDTKLYLTSAANWINAAGSNTHMRSFITWDYRNSGGFLYPPLTYSRNYSGYDTWSDGAVDYINNCITLKTPWNGRVIPAGTQISNGSSGSAYIYFGAVNSVVPNDWTKYTDTISGVSSNGINADSYNNFSPGTAYVKLLFLNNRDVAGSTVWYSNITFNVDIADKKSVDDLTVRISTAEQKITPSAITTTVKNSVEADGKPSFVQTSAMIQSIDNVTASFKNSGGMNILKNSTGLGGTDYWTTNGTSFTYYKDTTSAKYLVTGKGLYLANSNTSERYAWSAVFPLKPNTKYTLSGKYYVGYNCLGIDIYIMTSNVNRAEYETAYTTATLVTRDTTYSNGVFKEIVDSNGNKGFTFTTSADTLNGFIRIDNNGTDVSGTARYVYFGDLMLTEGDTTRAWSPHPTEIYEGIVKLSGSGIEVSHSDSSTKTEMTSEGFAVLGTDGAPLASFGMSNSIPTLQVTDITSPSILKVASNWAGSKTVYVAPTMTGDGTGRDVNNKSNNVQAAILNALKGATILDSTYDLTVNIAGGSYTQDVTINGLNGAGNLILDMASSVIWNGGFVFRNCGLTIRIKGNRTSTSANDGAIINPKSNLGWIGVWAQKCSYVWVDGVRSVVDRQTGTWPNFFVLTTGSVGLITNSDVSKYQAVISVDMTSRGYLENTRGSSNDLTGIAYAGSYLGVHGQKASPGTYAVNYGGEVVETNVATTTSCNPSLAPTYIDQVQTATFSAISYRSIRSDWDKPDYFAQANWTGYSAWTGYAYFSGIKSWLDGRKSGAAVTGQIYLNRANTSHGYNSAVPIRLYGASGTSLVRDYGVIANLGRGGAGWFTLPAQACTDLASGAVTNMAISASGESNYAVMENNCQVYLSTTFSVRQ